MAIIAWLEARPEVAAVYYAGSPEHPQRELSLPQRSGFGSMISFRLADPAIAGPFLERLGLVFYAESLGGAETLITYRARNPGIRGLAAGPCTARCLRGC